MRFSLNKNGVSVYEYKLTQRLQKAQNILVSDLFHNLQVFSPVRTGKLRNSYILENDGKVVTISNSCGYCQYVNYGTVKQSGQHFIEKSIIDALAQFQNKENEIKK